MVAAVPIADHGERMSIFSFITDLFSSTDDLERDVDEVAPRSSRTGRQQKCGVCHIEGHKAPSHQPGKVFDLQGRVGELQQQLEEARYLLAEMTDIAHHHKDRADIAEGQVRQYAARLDQMSQKLVGLEQRLADLENSRAPHVYGEPTSI
jgi:hypothetical protein